MKHLLSFFIYIFVFSAEYKVRIPIFIIIPRKVLLVILFFTALNIKIFPKGLRVLACILIEIIITWLFLGILLGVRDIYTVGRLFIILMDIIIILETNSLAKNFSLGTLI